MTGNRYNIEKEHLEDLYSNKKLSLKEISGIYKCPIHTIHYYRGKFGIPLRKRIFSKEHREKIGKTLRKLFDEGKIPRINSGSFKKGENRGHRFEKGYKQSEETRKKRIKSLIKAYFEGRKKKLYLIGEKNPFWGKHHSKETIKKIKEKRAKLILPVKDTSIELKIQNFLKQLNIEYFTHQYIKDIEHGYQCDILIPSMNMVIEADGDYWHKYPIGLDIDHIRTKELLEKGFKVLRLWEFEINDMTIEQFKERINEETKVYGNIQNAKNQYYN